MISIIAFFASKKKKDNFNSPLIEYIIKVDVFYRFVKTIAHYCINKSFGFGLLFLYLRLFYFLKRNDLSRVAARNGIFFLFVMSCLSKVIEARLHAMLESHKLNDTLNTLNSKVNKAKFLNRVWSVNKLNFFSSSISIIILISRDAATAISNHLLTHKTSIVFKSIKWIKEECVD